jgi:hypothetical protein
MPSPDPQIIFTDSEVKPSRFLVRLDGRPEPAGAAKAGPAKVSGVSRKTNMAARPFKERLNGYLAERNDFRVEFLSGKRKAKAWNKRAWQQLALLLSALIFIIRFGSKIFKIAFCLLIFLPALFKRLLLWRPELDRQIRPVRPRFKLNWKDLSAGRRIAAFAGILLLVALPLKTLHTFVWAAGAKERLLDSGALAVDELRSAAGSLHERNWDDVQGNLGAVSGQITALEEDISRVSEILGLIGTFMPIGPLRAGQEAAKAADIMAEAAAISRELSYGFAGLDEDIKFSQAFLRLRQVLDRTAGPARRLEEIIASVDPKNLPDKYRTDFEELRNRSVLAARGTAELGAWLDVLHGLLGYEMDKRYLLVFQNNSEMRASGGFMGSYALMDLRNGEIRNLEVPGGGTYDLEAGMRDFIAAPAPLQLLRSRWFFWDANWWPDWPLTARKLMQFYEKSDGPTVDGVIALTPSVMERFLQIIGPIDLSEAYGQVIDHHNFWDITQALAERKPDETKRPKQIIGDLFAAIIEQAPDRLDRAMIFELLRAGLDLCDEKHILLYFKDQSAERKLAEYGWSGEVKQSLGDYLLAVNSNIGGAKSDREVVQNISHTLEVQADGTILATTKLVREHRAIRGTEFTGQRNVNWFRLYVPEGAELVSALGFRQPDAGYFKTPEADWVIDPDVAAGEGAARRDERSQTLVYDELGKTVFANWSMVDPGESANLYLQYRLPQRLEMAAGASLPILIQKQPGMPSGGIEITAIAPPGWVWAGSGGRTFSWQDSLDKDKRLELVLGEGEGRN